jgi:hypothetical protein
MFQMKTEVTNDINAYFVAWHDNKPVHMLSSIPAYTSSCRRVVKNADGTWNPNQEIPRPSTIKIYNQGMGGTDAMDQNISYYRPKVKATSSWYPRCFIHIMVVCSINAYILYYKNLGINRKDFPYLNFLRELIDELAEEELSKANDNMDAVNIIEKLVKSKKVWERDTSRLFGVHMPQIINEETVETLNQNEGTVFTRKLKRAHCMLCRRSINTTCERCQIYLCCKDNPKFGMTCWKAFHTLKKIDLD